MRIRVCLAVVLFAAACSSGDSPVSAESPTTTTVAPVVSTPTTSTASTTTMPIDAVAFVLSPPPDGLSAVLVQSRGEGQREIGYSPGECGDRDVDLGIEIRPAVEVMDIGMPTYETAWGPVATIYELWDDGRRYGYGASFPFDENSVVDVTMRNRDDTLEDLYAVLDSVVAIDEVEWQRLNRVIGEDQRAIRDGEIPMAVTVGAGELGGQLLEVEFLIPEDFPLGADDCRSACYTMSLGDAVGDLECAASTTRSSLGENRVLTGRVPVEIENVEIAPYDGMVLADPTPPVVRFVEIPGMSDRLFVAEVPLDFCAWNVHRGLEFGAEQGGLRQSDPDYEDCTFAG